VLLASLFKLYEFGSQYCEALQVVLLLEHMSAVDVVLPESDNLDDASYAQALGNTLGKLGFGGSFLF
jgi:hypothetical protein